MPNPRCHFQAPPCTAFYQCYFRRSADIPVRSASRLGKTEQTRIIANAADTNVHAPYGLGLSSSFGFRVCFGLRHSDFGFSSPIPTSPALGIKTTIHNH